LIGNVDVWLCHQCGDCSSYCPREVRPANVIAAVRQRSYRHYARPRFLGKLVSEPTWLPLAILLPVLVIISILFLAGTFRIPEGPVDYSAFFPHGWLNGTFSAITLLSYGLASRGVGRFWRDMKQLSPPSGSRASIRKSLIPVLREVLSHSNFNRCGSRRTRMIAHMMLFFGFALLIAVTLFAICASISGNYPLHFTNPFKIAGNVASLMIYSGLAIMIGQRLTNRSIFGKSGYSDWLLLTSIGLLTLSGSLVEMARFGNWAIAYHLYFFHLVAVWFVIIYLPFTKLGHIVYRSAALLYARSIGRK
jgi:quinone-modifying oxidoreductase subunit QmoC